MPGGSDRAKEREEWVKGKRERERDITLVSEQQSEQSGAVQRTAGGSSTGCHHRAKARTEVSSQCWGQCVWGGGRLGGACTTYSIHYIHTITTADS